MDLCKAVHAGFSLFLVLKLYIQRASTPKLRITGQTGLARLSVFSKHKIQIGPLLSNVREKACYSCDNETD